MVSVIRHHGGQRREVREGLGHEATGDHSEHRHSGIEGLESKWIRLSCECQVEWRRRCRQAQGGRLRVGAKTTSSVETMGRGVQS